MQQIRKIVEKREIVQVVSVHESSFSNFFMTELGSYFLTVYYKSVSHNKNSILLGCYEDDSLLGFCAATYLSKGFYKKLIKENFLHYFFISIYLLLSKPASLIRLIKNLTKKNPEISDNGEYAELLSIATSVDSQGKGIGKKLLLQLEVELKLKSCTELSLTTDYYDNDKVISFYKNLSYNPLYDFVSYPNRKMYRMIKNII
ncbi:GNAT family N-acetyltransferase [Bacteroidia bacterium]|nr:GNAT family N-acetyltransferase [Bacteroidia bacterium]